MRITEPATRCKGEAVSKCGGDAAGKRRSALQDAFDVDHALLPQVERLLEALHFLVVALHDDLRSHLVVLSDDLHAHLISALSVVEVVLARGGRSERRTIPDVAQPAAECLLLED